MRFRGKAGQCRRQPGQWRSNQHRCPHCQYCWRIGRDAADTAMMHGLLACRCFIVTLHRHAMTVFRHRHRTIIRKRRHRHGGQSERNQEKQGNQVAEHGRQIVPKSVAVQSGASRMPIHSAIATIITFSVSETKPSGTLLFPPTQAHFSSRCSI